MFAETVLQGFANLADTVTLPQGYNAAVGWNLAELLLPEYGKNDPVIVGMIRENAANGRAWVKRTNMAPPPVMSFDPAIAGIGKRIDASWILTGGFLN